MKLRPPDICVKYLSFLAIHSHFNYNYPTLFLCEESGLRWRSLILLFPAIA